MYNQTFPMHLFAVHSNKTNFYEWIPLSDSHFCEKIIILSAQFPAKFRKKEKEPAPCRKSTKGAGICVIF